MIPSSPAPSLPIATEYGCRHSHSPPARTIRSQRKPLTGSACLDPLGRSGCRDERRGRPALDDNRLRVVAQNWLVKPVADVAIREDPDAQAALLPLGEGRSGHRSCSRGRRGRGLGGGLGLSLSLRCHAPPWRLEPNEKTIQQKTKATVSRQHRARATDIRTIARRSRARKAMVVTIRPKRTVQ